MRRALSLVVGLAGLAATIFLFAWLSAAAGERVGSGWVGATLTVPASQVIDRDYFAVGPLVTVSGTVNGDVYALGGQVLIDGRVNGDVLVGGGRVSISGNVTQDVRIAGGQVSLSGNIARNLTVFGGNVELTRSAVIKGGVVAAGGNVHLASPLGGSAKIAAGSLIVSNRVAGDIDAAVGDLRITSMAAIEGNVDYLSHREASVDAGAKIKGKLTRAVPPKLPRPAPQKVMVLIAGWGLFLIAVSFVSTLILGLLSVRYLPNYHASVVAVVRERPWPSLGIGFIAAVVTPVVCAILFATVFGVPIALILTASYFILLYWGRIFVMSRIGEAVFRLFRASPRPGWAFIVGLLIYYLVALIPVLGWLVVVLVVLFGLGAELIGRKNFYVAARRQEMI